MEDAIPFGHYELLSRINVGGMAEILKARDLDRPGGPPLAVKRILPHLTEDPQYVTMFLDESRVLAQLSHPNIIRTFDVGKVGPTPYLALEYVHGHDARMLFHRCRREGQPVALRAACLIMADVCAGLHFAHEHVDADGNLLGIVHRDVSLQNLLLSFEGDVKLIDFGIAMSSGNMARTEVGIVKGKFGYMSPEQVKGEPLDRRSDVFAAGICLYELLTGERLFSGDNDYAAVDKVRNVRIEPPSRLNRQIPSALESLVMKALAKSPRDRFQTAADMRRALLSFMAESGNTCTADQLAETMRGVFSDELDHPTQVEGAVIAKRDALTGLAAFDDLEPVSALTALDRAPEVVAAPPVRFSRPPPAKPASQGMRAQAGPTQASPAQSALATAQQLTPVQAIPTQTPGRRPKPLSEPPTSDLHLMDQQSAPVDMDWDEDEPITQHESVDGLPRLMPAEDDDEHSGHGSAYEARDDEQTRQVYVGATFSGVVAQGSEGGSGIHSGGLEPPQIAAGLQSSTSPFMASMPTYAATASIPPAVATEPPLRGTQRASYAAVVAVVATIIAVISVGLMATRSQQPASIHLSTMPTDAEVRVDDERIRLERSPFVISELEPEVVHQVDVSSSGYESWSTRITLQPGQVLKLPRVGLVPIVTQEPAHDPVARQAETEMHPTVAPAPKAHSGTIRPGSGSDRKTKREPKQQATKQGSKPVAKADAKQMAKAQPKQDAKAQPKQEPKAAEPKAAEPKQETAVDPSGVGILRINSRPWSQVAVDGRVVGNTPQMNVNLPAGTHTVTLVNSQFGYTKTLKIKLKAGEVVTKIVDLN